MGKKKKKKERRIILGPTTTREPCEAQYKARRAAGREEGARGRQGRGRPRAGPPPLQQRRGDRVVSRQARYSPRGGRKRAEETPHAGRPGAGGRGSLSLLTAARRAIVPTGRQGEKPQSAHLRPAGLRRAGAASHKRGAARAAAEKRPQSSSRH